MPSALSAIAISEPQHGRFHQLEASGRSMFVQQRDAHRVDGEKWAKHSSDKSRMHADRGLRHVRARLPQLVRRPVRNRRKFSQTAMRMMNPSTIGVMNGDM